MNDAELWRFLPVGYLFTVAVETPVLWLLLSPRHTLRRRLFAGLWLTACTYPVVVLVLPPLFDGSTRAAYLLVAEAFAPAAECVLFLAAFGREKDADARSLWRDFAAITAANLLSFLAGEAAARYSWFGLLG
ncbi:MAG TPA: hypothetical protein VF588_19670 [Pyrinomonadaceae bacterium]|jgi:hypothetical protein